MRLAVDVGHINFDGIREAGFAAKVGIRVRHRDEVNAEGTVVGCNDLASGHRFRFCRMPPAAPSAAPPGVHLVAVDGVGHLGATDGHSAVGGGNTLETSRLAKSVYRGWSRKGDSELGLLVCFDDEIFRFAAVLASPYRPLARSGVGRQDEAALAQSVFVRNERQGVDGLVVYILENELQIAFRNGEPVRPVVAIGQVGKRHGVAGLIDRPVEKEMRTLRHRRRCKRILVQPAGFVANLVAVVGRGNARVHHPPRRLPVGLDVRRKIIVSILVGACCGQCAGWAVVVPAALELHEEVGDRASGGTLDDETALGCAVIAVGDKDDVLDLEVQRGNTAGVEAGHIRNKQQVVALRQRRNDGVRILPLVVAT